MTLLIGAMFLGTAIVCLAIVYVFDAIERSTSRQGYPPSVFRRRL